MEATGSENGMPNARRETTCPELSRGQWRRLLAVLGIAAMVCGVAPGPAQAERQENPTAVFAALDKVTAKISAMSVDVNATKPFGALRVTPRVCYSRPPTEPPKTTAFVEVDEVLLDGTTKRIFTGWMFAESPGISGVEHPVFDIWLTGCAAPRTPVAKDGAGRRDDPEEQPRRRRRVRR